MSSDQPRILDLSPLIVPPGRTLWLLMMTIITMFTLIGATFLIAGPNGELPDHPSIKFIGGFIGAIFVLFFLYMFYRIWKYFWLNKMVRQVIHGDTIPQLKSIFLANGVSADIAVAPAAEHLKNLSPLLEKIQVHKETSLGNKIRFYGSMGLLLLPALAADWWISYKTNLLEEPYTIVTSIVLALIIPFFIVKRRRRLQLNAGALLAIDDRRPIVHLRSFGDDEVQIKSIAGDATKSVFGRFDMAATFKSRLLWQTIRLEEALAGIARSFGPFIAIGEPNEKMPDIGAARAYLGDDQWQEKVAQWMEKSLLITMIGGITPGLLWELDHLLKTGQPGKLIIFFPPSKIKLMQMLRPGITRTQRVDSVLGVFKQHDPSLEIPEFDKERCICISLDQDAKLNYITSDYTNTDHAYHMSFLFASARLLS